MINLYANERQSARVQATESNDSVRNSEDFDSDIDSLTSVVRLMALCEHGKAALGLGNNSIGDFLPRLLHEAEKEQRLSAIAAGLQYLLSGRKPAR